MKFKKPITEFTFQDAEYLVVKIAELLNSLFVLIGGLVDGIKSGEIYAYGTEEEAEA